MNSWLERVEALRRRRPPKGEEEAPGASKGGHHETISVNEAFIGPVTYHGYGRSEEAARRNVITYYRAARGLNPGAEVSRC